MPYDLGEEALLDSSLLPGMFKELLAAFAKENCARFRSSLSRTSASLTHFVSWRRQSKLEKSLSQSQRRTPSIEKWPPRIRFRDNATYLITGGLGGTWFGNRDDGWLAKVRATWCSSDVTPRTGNQEQSLRRVDSCRYAGSPSKSATSQTKWHWAPRSIGFQDRCRRFGEFIHAAGVLDDAMLEQQTWSRFASGHGAESPRSLESSSSDDVPRIGLFCPVLRGRELWSVRPDRVTMLRPMHSWTDWHITESKGIAGIEYRLGRLGQAGMAARLAKKDVETVGRPGLRPIQLTEGMVKLGRMMLSPFAQVVAAPIDWLRIFVGNISGRPPSLFSALVGVFRGTTLTDETTTGPDEKNFLRRLSAEPAGSPTSQN